MLISLLYSVAISPRRDSIHRGSLTYTWAASRAWGFRLVVVAKIPAMHSMALICAVSSAQMY